MSYPGNNQPPPYGQPQQGYPPPGYPPQQGGPQYGSPPQQGMPPQQGGPQYRGPQYGGPQYGGPQYGGPQQGGPQYGMPGQPQYGGPSPRKGKGGAVVLALVGMVVVVVLVAVVVLSRVGVIDGGPFAKGVPSVPPPSEFPATAGGLYRLDNGDPATFKVGGAKYDWVVAKYYATKPLDELDNKTPVYVATVYGPLAKAKDAITTRNNLTEVGDGLCGDGSPSAPVRVCAVQRGSIVATITESIKPTGRTSTDDDLIGYAAALANALS